jgi:hypothetical protein
MSTALAIGAVTAVLRNVLDNGMIDAVNALGGTVKVSALAPDLIKLDEAAEAPPQLNLFVYRVTLNPGWRNVGLPSRDNGGRRIANPPLGVDIHYLLTAYGRKDLDAEILLGYGMHLLHERPFLDRAAIRQSLQLQPVDNALLPAAFRAPASAGLADQLETLKITWEPMNLEEISKIWAAIQSHYRPTAAYQVSVVLIEATRPASDPLPVLRRHVDVVPALTPPYPAIDAVSAADGTTTAELGEQITLHGRHLAGNAVTVNLTHLLTSNTIPLVGANTDPTKLTFNLPSPEPVNPPWPAGVWAVSVTLTPFGESRPRTTNIAALLLAPVPDIAAVNVARNAATDRVTVTIPVTPRLRAEQTVTLSLNGAQATVPARPGPIGQVAAEFAPVPVGQAALRIRVDGVDSRIIDYSVEPPAFRPDRQVNVP